MSLTPEESAKLNTAVNACARAADTVEDVLSLMKSGDAGSAAAAVATHDNAADAHKSLFSLYLPKVNTLKMITTRKTIYVRVDGSDDNGRDGLSEVAAMKTLGAAVQRARFFWTAKADVNAAAVTIDIGPGTFASAYDTNSLFLNALPVFFHGNGVGKTVIKNFVIRECENLIVENLTVTEKLELIKCSGIVRNINASAVNISHCRLINMNFGLDQTLKIENNAANSVTQLLHAYASNVRLYGQIILNAEKITRGAVLLECSSCLYPAGTNSYKGLSGSVSGRRYYLSMGSIINSGGRGEEWIPGTEPGTKDASCFYL